MRRPSAFARLRRAVLRLVAERGGTAAIEFAIIAPVLVTVIYGSVELGRLLYADHAVGHAARESTRFAMVRSAESDDPATPDQIEDVARRAAILDPDRLSVETVYDPDATPGSTVTVRVSYGFVPMIPYLTPREISLEGQSVKRIVN